MKRDTSTLVDWLLRVFAFGLSVFVFILIAFGLAWPGARQSVIGMVLLISTVTSAYQAYAAMAVEGPPRGLPLSFRWSLALWLTSTAVFLSWHFAVAVFDVYSREGSLIMWLVLGQGWVYFFRRWMLIDRTMGADQDTPDT